MNITIGRAFSLCLRNLGYWYPGQMDMDTIGTTRKFVHCIAENEEMSPWQPFHVDQGFGAGESAVSVFITDGELDVQDQGNTSAEGLLKTIAYGSTFGTYGLGGSHGAERLIFMPPDVARPVGGQGFSKQEARQLIHFHANQSLGKMIQYMPIDDARVGQQWQWLKGLTERERLEITVPLLESVDRWYIVVVGADRAKTLVMPTGEGVSTVGHRPVPGLASKPCDRRRTCSTTTSSLAPAPLARLWRPGLPRIPIDPSCCSKRGRTTRTSTTCRTASSSATTYGTPPTARRRRRGAT